MQVKRKDLLTSLAQTDVFYMNGWQMYFHIFSAGFILTLASPQLYD